MSQTMTWSARSRAAPSRCAIASSSQAAASTRAPEPETVVIAPRRSLPRLAEGIEDVGEGVRRESRAIVADLDAREPAFGARRDADRAARARRLDRVRDQVHEHLADAIVVALDL